MHISAFCRYLQYMPHGVGNIKGMTILDQNMTKWLE
jgi:hypothetical protein